MRLARPALVPLCALAAVVSGCSFGPIWAPTVAGRVVDAETNRPVPGAEVYSWYRVTLLGVHSSWVEWYTRQTTTDSNGRFAIPGHSAIHFEVGHTESRPTVLVFHPDYGTTTVSPDTLRGLRGLEIELREKERDLDLLLDPDQGCTSLPYHDLLYRLAFGCGVCDWDRNGSC